MKAQQSVNNLLASDNRFYINPETLLYLSRKPIYDYEITEIQIGKIRRKLWGKVFSLYKTESWQYLQNPNNEIIKNKYQRYAKIATVDKADRTEKTYQDLILSFSNNEYDIKKGIIVINQYYFIEEGLHRCCILLMKYGEKHRIQVLKIKRSRCSKKILIRNFIYNVKKALHIDC